MVSGLAKFIIGVFTGILILVAAGAAAGYYFMTKTTVSPPKPIYSEERENKESVDNRKGYVVGAGLALSTGR